MATEMQTTAWSKTPKQTVMKMQHRWDIAFVAALLLVVGYAAGFLGAVFAIVVFAVAVFLQWANTSGFAGAQKKIPLDRFGVPFWKAENWQALSIVFADRETFERAVTCAVVSIALLLLLPAYLVLGFVVVVAGWFTFRIYGSYSAISGKTNATSSEPEL
jgi:hypothetical protein